MRRTVRRFRRRSSPEATPDIQSLGFLIPDDPIDGASPIDRTEVFIG